MCVCISAVPQAMVVRFDKKTGAAEVKTVADLDVAFACFKAALFLFNACNEDLLLELQSVDQ